MPDFEHIVYLQHGSAIQQQVFHLLHDKKILYHLKMLKPVVAGTIPLDLFIPGRSDVDILGSHDNLPCVEKNLLRHFATYSSFHIQIKPLRGEQSLICRFVVDRIPFEIFVQPIPVTRQYGYRHLRIEYWLLATRDEAFRTRIVDLKKAGMKTEPAFALALGLTDDPYEKLLDFEQDNEFLRFVEPRSTL